MSERDTGNCFVAALETAQKLGLIMHDVRVCHGMPIGVGPDNKGHRFWHAWVEAKPARDGKTFVFDASVGDGAVRKLTRANYYRLGQIDGDNVLRFDPYEVLDEIEARGHAGPWIDNYEGMAL